MFGKSSRKRTRSRRPLFGRLANRRVVTATIVGLAVALGFDLPGRWSKPPTTTVDTELVLPDRDDEVRAA